METAEEREARKAEKEARARAKASLVTGDEMIVYLINGRTKIVGQITALDHRGVRISTQNAGPQAWVPWASIAWMEETDL